jgi:monoamine oxidase
MVARIVSALSILLFVGVTAVAQQSVKVLIIGGGISGMATLDHLKEKGIKDVLLVESANRVGGRMWTQRGKGPHYERGAELVNTSDTSLKKLLNKYSLPLVHRKFKKTNSEETFLFRERIKEGDSYKLGPQKSYTFHQLVEEANKIPQDVQALEKFSNIQRDRESKDVAKKSAADKYLRENTAADIVEDTELFKAFMHAFIVSEFGVALDKLSAEVVADYMTVLPTKGGHYKIELFPGSDEKYRIKHGTDSIIVKISEKHFENIMTKTKAVSIEEKAENSFVTQVVDSDGNEKTILSEHVVVAVPAHQLLDLNIDSPSLEKSEIREAAEMPFCSNSKIFLRFSKKFWYSGKNRFAGVAVLESGVQVWDTSEDQSDKLGGLITLYPGSWPTSKSDQDRRLKEIMEELKGLEIFKDMDKYLVDVDHQIWKQSYAGAFSPAYPAPPALFSKQIKSQIYFVGSDKDVSEDGKINESFGYMEGGVRTGEKAARKIVTSIKKRKPQGKKAA